MSTESIKKLVQFENEAKEMLEEANKKYDNMKKQAMEDAKEVVKVEVENNSQRIEDQKVQVEEFIKLMEKKKKEEFEEKVLNLSVIENRDALVDELLRKVCKK